MGLLFGKNRIEQRNTANLDNNKKYSLEKFRDSAIASIVLNKITTSLINLYDRRIDLPHAKSEYHNWQYVEDTCYVLVDIGEAGVVVLTYCYEGDGNYGSTIYGQINFHQEGFANLPISDVSLFREYLVSSLNDSSKKNWSRAFILNGDSYCGKCYETARIKKQQIIVEYNCFDLDKYAIHHSYGVEYVVKEREKRKEDAAYKPW